MADGLVLTTRNRIRILDGLLILVSLAICLGCAALFWEMDRRYVAIQGQIRALENQAERPQVTNYNFPVAEYPVVEQVFQVRDHVPSPYTEPLTKDKKPLAPARNGKKQ